MLERIEMNVIQMTVQIILIPPGVIPKPALPNRGLAAPLANEG